MKPHNIFLIRHGQSVGNVDKTIYTKLPDYAVPLTDKGIAQASQVGLDLLPEIRPHYGFFAYVSPFRRTKETFINIVNGYKLGRGEAFKKTEVAFREDPRIREQEWTNRMLAAGFKLDEEREREAYGHFYYRFDGGESNADVYDRMSSFLDTLHRDFEKPDFPTNCLIVAHGMSIRVLLMRWFHMSVEDFEMLRNPKNCQVIKLQLQYNCKYKLVSELERYKEPTHGFHFPLLEAFK